MSKIRVPEGSMTHEEVVEKVIAMESEMDTLTTDSTAIKLALFGDGNGNKGVVRKIDSLFSDSERRWKRSDIIALIGILILLIAAPFGVVCQKALEFYQEMEQFHDEFKQVHHSELPQSKQKSFSQHLDELYTVRNSNQSAGGFYQ